jgi:hypothetical protein
MDDHHFNDIAKMEKKEQKEQKNKTLLSPDKCITIFTKINMATYFSTHLTEKCQTNAINVFAIKKKGLHSSNLVT